MQESDSKESEQGTSADDNKSSVVQDIKTLFRFRSPGKQSAKRRPISYAERDNMVLMKGLRMLKEKRITEAEFEQIMQSHKRYLSETQLYDLSQRARATSIEIEFSTHKAMSRNLIIQRKQAVLSAKAAKKRQEEVRKLRRERRQTILAVSRDLWIRDIVTWDPVSRASYIKDVPKMKTFCWQAACGCPSDLRGSIWKEILCHDCLADHSWNRNCQCSVCRLLSFRLSLYCNTISAEDLETLDNYRSIIEVDIPRTFPQLKFSQELPSARTASSSSADFLNLRDILLCYAINHHPRIGYVQGMSYLVGVLYLCCSDYGPEIVFKVFECLMKLPLSTSSYLKGIEVKHDDDDDEEEINMRLGRCESCDARLELNVLPLSTPNRKRSASDGDQAVSGYATDIDIRYGALISQVSEVEVKKVVGMGFCELFRLRQGKALELHMKLFESIFMEHLPMLHRYIDCLYEEVMESGFISPLLSKYCFFLDWTLTLFSRCLPIDICIRVWDLFIIQTYNDPLICIDTTIFRIAIGILKFLAPTISRLKLDKLSKFLQSVPEHIWEITDYDKNQDGGDDNDPEDRLVACIKSINISPKKLMQFYDSSAGSDLEGSRPVCVII